VSYTVMSSLPTNKVWPCIPPKFRTADEGEALRVLFLLGSPRKLLLLLLYDCYKLLSQKVIDIFQRKLSVQH